jgi:hypothetical protein
MIVVDNSTRWNSTYFMIHHALKLCMQIMLFCVMNTDDLKEDVLSQDEWSDLKEIKLILEPFQEVTKWLEGNAKDAHHGSI